MRESDLAKLVADWMREQGYRVYSEIPLGIGSARVIDLVGIKLEKDLIIIELKRSATKQVFHQLYLAQLFTNEIYIGMAGNPRKATKEKCRKYNIGLLSLIKGKVTEIIVPSRLNSEMVECYRNDMIDRLKLTEPSDEAGNPTRKGIGPAIDCAERIRKYLSTHKTASWKDIYKDVQNHYSSVASMRGVMTQHFGINITHEE